MGAKRYESSSLRNNNIINQFLEKIQIGKMAKSKRKLIK